MSTPTPKSTRVVQARQQTTAPVSSQVVVTIRLNEALYDVYAEQAIKAGRDVGDEIAQRLIRCVDYNAQAPLYLDDAQRGELERALGHNLSKHNIPWMIARLSELLTLKVGEVEVPLPEQVQARLRTRVFRGEDYASVLKREVINGLKRFVGLL